MSFEQKRNAERLPLETPIEGSASGTPVTIVELSAIGCRIEHKEKLALNSTVALKFTWRDVPVDLRAKVMRLQLRPGMTYESGLKFADSLAEAPDVMRAIVASLVKEDLPEEIATELPQPEEAELIVPVEFEDIVIRKPAPEQELEVEIEEEPEPEAQPEAEPEPDVEPEPEPEPAPAVFDLIECRLEGGVWHRRRVTVVHQPDEGFITQPASDRELDELCRTYAYADPETRRLIRITLELRATQKRD